jgi:SAM-dependent methyltransferase
MNSYLKRLYYSEQYHPRFLALFINPFFLARRSLWKAIARFSGQLKGPLLDVGCGSKPYRVLFPVSEYIGLDIDSDIARKRGIADAFYDGATVPFGEDAFQSVLCNQVLEHVFTPEEFVREIWRVLKPGGRLLLTVPFVWDEHEQPSSFGLAALLKRNGFLILQQRKMLDDFSMLVQLTIAYFYKVCRTRSPWVNLTVAIVLFAPLTLLGLILGAVLPRNPDLFLDQLVLAEKPYE